MSFGERLQALRRSSGMTQEEFAQQLKVSRQAVSKWESSRGYPEMEKIIYRLSVQITRLQSLEKMSHSIILNYSFILTDKNLNLLNSAYNA